MPMSLMGGFGGFSLGAISNIMATVLYCSIGVAVLAVILFYGLITMKKRRFICPVVIVRKLGEGRIALEQTRAGRFRKKKIFFNLLDTGGEMEWLVNDGITKVGRKIQVVSDYGLIDINFKKGFLVQQSPEDPKILTMIDKADVQGVDILLQVANANIRNAASDAIHQTQDEMSSSMEKYLPMITPVIVMILCLCVVVILTQFWQRGMDSTNAAMAKMISQGCTQALTKTGAGAP